MGSDATAVKTSAVKTGDEYIINGTKRYITNAPRAGTFTVMVRTDSSIKGAKGISTFIVDATTPGISLFGVDIAKLSLDDLHFINIQRYI